MQDTELQNLLDYVAIRQLNAKYNRYADLADGTSYANLFTEDAEFYDEFGVMTNGCENIVELFKVVFEESPEAQIDEIRLERVRYINKTVALEEGVVVARTSASDDVQFV